MIVRESFAMQVARRAGPIVAQGNRIRAACMTGAHSSTTAPTSAEAHFTLMVASFGLGSERWWKASFPWGGGGHWAARPGRTKIRSTWSPNGLNMDHLDLQITAWAVRESLAGYYLIHDRKLSNWSFWSDFSHRSPSKIQATNWSQLNPTYPRRALLTVVVRQRFDRFEWLLTVAIAFSRPNQ